jgi:hypothetical protein
MSFKLVWEEDLRWQLELKKNGVKFAFNWWIAFFESEKSMADMTPLMQSSIIAVCFSQRISVQCINFI